jgi:hypothetical protein
MLVPFRLALALQDDGWIVRSDVCWAKSSPMPESVSGWRWQQCRVKVKANEMRRSSREGHRPQLPLNGVGGPNAGSGAGALAEWIDCPGCPRCEPNNGLILRRGSWRPTRSWEHIFMLVKGDTYFADGEPVRTKAATATLERERYSRIVPAGSKSHVPGTADHSGIHKQHGPATYAVAHDHESFSRGRANLRDVWRLKGEPLKLKHYAAFPPSLPTQCLKASTSERGVCGACGAQWVRVVEARAETGDWNEHKNDRLGLGHQHQGLKGDDFRKIWQPASTLGFRASCRCGASTIPAIVLDPFSGAGTTVLVARRLGLRAVGIELNPKYAAMARRRIEEDSPLFNR